MIKGMHGMFYSDKAAELRAFLRDKLGFPARDIGEGWLIFDLPAADIGVHPADETGRHGSAHGTHDISFYCEDIEETVRELRSKGVAFKDDIQDHGYGWVTYIHAPGDVYLQLYQPKYSS